MGDFGGCLFAAIAYTNAPSFVKKPEPLVTADFQRHERLRAIPSASGKKGCNLRRYFTPDFTSKKVSSE